MPRGIPNRKNGAAKASRGPARSTNIDMDRLTSADLREIGTKALAKADDKEGQEKEDLKNEVTQLVESRGYTLQELFGKRPGRKPGQLASAGKNTTRAEPGKIYVNPDNKEDVYKGRGRRPEWLQVWMQKHGDDFSSLGRNQRV